MQAEKGNFVRVILDVLNFTVSVSDEEEYSYVTFKEEIPKKLCFIYQKHIASEQKEQEVDKLKEKCYEKLHITHRNLMNSLCMCFDLIFELVNTFEIEISSIIQKYLQDVQELFQEIMQLDELYILQLKEFYFRLFNTGSIYDMEVKDHTGEKIELDPIFKQVSRMELITIKIISFLLLA
ncbi:uncharacterized protein TNIN_180761 [Trichonephila inaurata madagascariensis]|uniref:Uncharacterized protein n=1 Tax=Trichonephila inaurata madagascariensis TaxID=2747483 RepID=A0A8X6YII7_9ARAC|nr:uncharacterized protein TNIN_180761 [Trichonephila inaurata madagascariensis]